MDTGFRPETKSSSHLPCWSVERAVSPIVATAIHDGHAVRSELEALYGLTSDERLREEDPFTASMIVDVPNRITFHRSRFEIDLNRGRDGAVYVRPEQAWGLNVWSDTLAPEHVDVSLQLHDDYYEMLHSMLSGIERRHGKFVVLDLHSYNHRRDGPDGAPTDPAKAPDINIGTISMDRDRWAPVVDALMEHFRGFPINGKPLDVQENVAFQGKGEQTRFVHEHFAENGCAIAVEFKKFFMDEWTGEPHRGTIEQLRAMIAGAVPVLEKVLGEQT